MPINYPTYKNIIDRIRADIAGDLPNSDPTIFGSFLRAFADSNGGRSFDIVQLIKQLENEMMPDTASIDFLKRWAAYEGLTQISARAASGNITVPGTASTTLPAGTQYTSESGNIYETSAAVTVASQSLAITSITRAGTTATVTTDLDEHELASGITVTIVGSDQSEYNGSQEITVTGLNTFTYSVSGSPATPATGTITADYDGVSATVSSNDSGLDQNVDSGAALTIVTPISGIDDTAYVQYDALTGGADEESKDELYARVLDSRANPVENFNPGAIRKTVLAIAGVTRVWVDRVTPGVGDVTVTFMRDNDDSAIPSDAEVLEVRNVLLDILPAQSDEDDLYVQAPTPVSTNYTFVSINPNTDTMQAAIEASLEAFYQDEVDYATDIQEDKYRSAIINTIDPNTSLPLLTFELSTPSGDISISDGEIGVLGTVSF